MQYGDSASTHSNLSIYHTAPEGVQMPARHTQVDTLSPIAVTRSDQGSRAPSENRYSLDRVRHKLAREEVIFIFRFVLLKTLHTPKKFSMKPTREHKQCTGERGDQEARGASSPTHEEDPRGKAVVGGYQGKGRPQA